MKKSYLFLIIFFVNCQVLSQWHSQNSGFTNEPFYACHFLDNQNGWVVGGRQLKTTDGGLTWTDKSPIPLGQGWAYSVFLLDTLKVLIGGANQLFMTTDGGDSWNVVYSFPAFYDCFSIYFIDSNRGWIAGGYLWDHGNFLGYTENGGLTWSEIQVPTNNCLRSVTFSDSLHGYAVGFGGFIMKATDGGYNWFQNSWGNNILNSIQFVSKLNGWMTGHGGVYRTTNGGLDWNIHIINPNYLVPYRTVFFVDSLNGYTGAGNGIFYTSNGGINWSQSDWRGGIESIYFINELEGWAVGLNGLILHTTNGGEIPVELSSFTASSSKNTVYLTWSTASELNNYGFEIERKDNKTEWLTIGFREGKGTTTEQQNYTYTDDLFGVNSHKLYYRLKQIDYDGRFEYSNVLEVNVASMNFALHQNYPNPFNPSTRISWQSPVGSHQVLKVFDVLGREVATLVNEYREAGYHEVDFQLALGSLPDSKAGMQYASGIYYYQLRAGNFIATKKMMVVR